MVFPSACIRNGLDKINLGETLRRQEKMELLKAVQDKLQCLNEIKHGSMLVFVEMSPWCKPSKFHGKNMEVN